MGKIKLVTRSFFCLTLTIFASVSAITEEELSVMREMMHGTIVTCMQDFKDDIKSEELFDKEPCFLACIFKGNDVINDKGMYDPGKDYEIALKYMKNADEIAAVKKATEICTKVNDVKVSDGTKGCERAMLLKNCFIENDVDQF